MRTLSALAALFLIAAPTPARAQVVPNTFTDLPVLLKPGDRVTVIDSSGLETSGRVGELSTTSMSIRGRQGDRRFGEADVVVIRQLQSDSLLNGTLVGVAIGVGIGLVADLSCGNGPSCGSTGEVIGGSAVWGVNRVAR